MKLILKVFKWLIITAFSIGLVGIIGFVYYLETSIDRVTSKEKQEKIWRMFNQSEALPEKFYATIEKYYPLYFKLGVCEFELKFYLGLEYPKSPYNQLYIHPGFADTLVFCGKKLFYLNWKNNVHQENVTII